MKKLYKGFLLCGLTGWCMEILFTALDSLRRRDYSLKGFTSLWMFPIYGCGVFLTPLFRFLQKKGMLIRGIIYSLFIFFGEYISGTLLAKHSACPWDYGKSKWNIKQIVRLDYLLNWLFAGLLFEWLLTRQGRQRK